MLIYFEADSRGIFPARVLSSSYMTSLNAPGFSISLLNLSSACRRFESSDESYTPSHLLEYLDALTDATAWSGVRTGWSDREDRGSSRELEPETHLSRSRISDQNNRNAESSITWRSLDVRPDAVVSGIRNACKAVLSVEPDLTRFDTLVGDGDCGETFSSGARGQSLLSYCASWSP